MRAFYLDELDMRPLAEWDRGPEEKGIVLVFTGRTSTASVEVLAAPEGGTAPEGIELAGEVDNVGAHYE